MDENMTNAPSLSITIQGEELC
uniref:Uncharacterized protein n=1 Tax=Arundo donax TaxID=35708 RepID=A0A0A9BB05_ARUDO